jgi:branched-chain amino acid aminotransferase
MSIVPFDKREGLIWMDGKLVDWADAKIHTLSHGLHYASLVFEGVRMYNGKIFKLTEHSERLRRSGQELGFEVPYSVEELNAACEEVCRVNGITDGYIRPFAWRGSEMMAVSAQHTTIHVAVAAWPWPSYFSQEARLEGISLQVSQWRRPAPDTAPTKSKAAGLYMICTLSKHTADAAGFDDALMLDYRGHVAEATGANIFLVIDGALHTPIPDCFLDGITRRTVMDLAKRRGIEVVERTILLEDFAKAQEVFLTGTAAEVTPVRQVDNYTFTPAEMCRTLMADYDAEVGRKAANQAAE